MNQSSSRWRYPCTCEWTEGSWFDAEENSIMRNRSSRKPRDRLPSCTRSSLAQAQQAKTLCDGPQHSCKPSQFPIAPCTNRVHSCVLTRNTVNKDHRGQAIAKAAPRDKFLKLTPARSRASRSSMRPREHRLRKEKKIFLNRRRQQSLIVRNTSSQGTNVVSKACMF